MPSFTFIASNCLAFDALTLEESPLGGTETAVIRLSEALANRGHSVTVYTKHPSPRSSKVKYISLSSFKEGFQTDVLIGVREWIACLVAANTKSRYFWTGDSFDQTTTYGIGDRRVSNQISGLICVSAWHATTLSSHAGFPIDKTYVIRNGVHLPYFEKERARGRKNLIYSSTPYRGLDLIPKLLPLLREKHPDANLNVYSGYQVYGGGAGHDLLAFEELSKKLSTEPGISMHGNVTQRVLAEKFLESSVLFYPNTFSETSCITALEAQAAGCVVLSSDLGAMPESVGDCGILIEGNPRSSEYQEAFIKAADNLLSNDILWDELSKKSIAKIRSQYSWDRIALQFETLTLPNLEKP
jgi:glycosyltransferase involved in cell wall biosynthesis